MMHRAAMKRAGRKVCWSLLVVLTLVACGDAPTDVPVVTPAPAAGLAQLLGPWQRQPFAVEPAILGAADQHCRRELPEIIADPAVKLVLVDARGGGHLSLVYVGPDSEGQCDMRLRRDGSFEPMGGTGGDGRGFVVLDPNNLEIRSLSSMGGDGMGDAMTSVGGLAGSGLAGVRVMLPNGEAIEAAVGGGWFSAWWPGQVRQFRVVGLDEAGNVVAEARQ